MTTVKSLFLFLLLKVILAEIVKKNTTDPIIYHWISSNFGSSFAAHPCLYDIDHDGHLDIISASVDGEIAVYNLKTGDSLIDGNWPIYLTNDHFYSQPVVYIHGESRNKELITITSNKGRIYYFEWKGILVRTAMITNIYLLRNWTFVQYKQLSEIIVNQSTTGVAGAYYELYPEVFADVNLMDLSVSGVMNDLVIPVNFVSKEIGVTNVIVAAIIVFNLQSGTVVDIHLLSISKMDSEYPGFLLSNIEIIRDSFYRIVVTSTSGIIYQLQWNKDSKTFQLAFNGDITYNQGPHNCQLTAYCSDLMGAFIDNYLCCLYVDFYGHTAMIDLVKHRPMWEYKSLIEAIPSPAKIFVDDHQSPYVVYADDKGWIHCISLLTGTVKELFPLHISPDTFSSSPDIITAKDKQISVILISDQGNVYLIPLANPKQYKSIFHNIQLATYLPPLLLPCTADSISLHLIVHSKTGFISRLEIPNFKRKDESVARIAINSVNPNAIGTLYGLGSTFSIVLQIRDIKAQVLKSTKFYIIKVFINEYLYCTHNEPSSGHINQDVTIAIDLSKLNRTLIPESVFIFGTATVLVIDSSGIAFPPDFINIRINYDFQFELIWIVYLTFFLCCAAIVLFHIYDSNDKLYIPVHINRDH